MSAPRRHWFIVISHTVLISLEKYFASEMIPFKLSLLKAILIHSNHLAFNLDAIVFAHTFSRNGFVFRGKLHFISLSHSQSTFNFQLFFPGQNNFGTMRLDSVSHYVSMTAAEHMRKFTNENAWKQQQQKNWNWRCENSWHFHHKFAVINENIISESSPTHPHRTVSHTATWPKLWTNS